MQWNRLLCALAIGIGAASCGSRADDRVTAAMTAEQRDTSVARAEEDPLFEDENEGEDPGTTEDSGRADTNADCACDVLADTRAPVDMGEGGEG